MDKEAQRDELDKELAMHNAKFGGNTDIYQKLQQDKLNEELTKFREEKQKDEKVEPAEAAKNPEEKPSDSAAK